MVDAVIEEIDGRYIRIGDHWLTDYRVLQLSGLRSRRGDHRGRARVPVAWGTHPELVAPAGQPDPLRADRGQADRAAGRARTALVLPTITHIHMSVIPVLAGGGTMFLDARAHKTIYDGCAVAKRRGATVVRFAHDDLDELEAALARDWRRPRHHLHRRRQQHDRQRPGPASVAALARDTAPCSTSTTPTASAWSASASARDAVRLRQPWQQHRAPPERELRQHRPRRRLLQGVLVAAGVHRLPHRDQAGAQDRGAALPVLRPLAGGLACDDAGGSAASTICAATQLRRTLSRLTARVLGTSASSASTRPTARASRSSRSRWPTPTASARSATCCSTAAST